MIIMGDFTNQTDKQNKNVIVWLDFGPLAYLNFGIASALSKIENYNNFFNATRLLLTSFGCSSNSVCFCE